MSVDLRRIAAFESALGSVESRLIENHAALALQRDGHRPGSLLALEISTINAAVTNISSTASTALDWEDADLTQLRYLDENKVTEFGAEGVALTITAMEYGWTVDRRLQRGEHADWQMMDPTGTLAALEVSGTRNQSLDARVRVKVDQVMKAFNYPLRVACVVSFGPPATSIAVIRR